VTGRLKSLTETTDDLAEELLRSSESFVHHSLIELTAKPYDQWPPILRAYGFAGWLLADHAAGRRGTARQARCDLELPAVHHNSGHDGAALPMVLQGLLVIAIPPCPWMALPVQLRCHQRAGLVLVQRARVPRQRRGPRPDCVRSAPRADREWHPQLLGAGRVRRRLVTSGA